MKIYYVLVLCAAFWCAACHSAHPAANSSDPATANSPSGVIRAYIDAHNRKDAEGMKQTFSADSLKMYEFMARRDKTSVNGLIEGQLKATPANMQTLQIELIKEEIEGETAIIETKNTVTNEFAQMTCVRENGQWKLAIDKFIKDALKKNKS